MEGLSLDDDVPGLGLDDEEIPALDLGEDELKMHLKIKLDKTSPYLRMPESLLLGKVVEGFKVVAIHDILPPMGDDWERELELVQV